MPICLYCEHSWATHVVHPLYIFEESLNSSNISLETLASNVTLGIACLKHLILYLPRFNGRLFEILLMDTDSLINFIQIPTFFIMSPLVYCISRSFIVSCIVLCWSISFAKVKPVAFFSYESVLGFRILFP